MAYAWFDVGDGRMVYRRVREPVQARSLLPAPMVVSDSMDPTEHPHDGMQYDSKSAFRRVTRQNGYVEVGTEKLEPFQRKSPNRKGIREALQKAKAAVIA